ncbi:response regulator [Desulfonema magnum]|uniref:Two component system system response regulator n=1 Tax=Desulfonema magnum TaxID=45655 RepID=A0A975BSG7_9BACT|nr:response regulator [Desulfonema magnum]QTA90384.1 Two component system system response regulator [Desulfonema magnum]
MNEQPIKVLIIEDEEMVRINLEDFLEDDGFEVKSADSGELGMELLGEYKFEIVVVDMRLPGMDGNTFIKEANKIQPLLNFIIHTGSAFYTLPKEFRDMGITKEQVLLKPLSDMEILTRAIRKLQTKK